MTLKFLDLYNEVAGQAWSMFDPDAESKEDFESALKTSINKALSAIWNSYPFTFRYKKQKISVKAGRTNYNLPNGNIIKKTIRGDEVYGLKIDGNYLKYKETEGEEEKTGTPESFYVEGNTFILYPIPDKEYQLTVEYNTLYTSLNSDGDSLYELSDDEDYIDIPEKYETIFKNCLITLSMVYAIADETDENYAGYMYQYQNAYNILMKYQKGINRDKRIYW